MANGRAAAWLRVLLFPVVLGMGVATSAEEMEYPPRVVIRSPPAHGHGRYMSRGIAPPGSTLHAILGVQIANGQAAQMVLYGYDFLPGSGQLRPRGYFQLAKIARRLEVTPFLLVIEPTGVPKLDEARRLHVLEVLGESPFAVAAERVIVAPPPARWLDGEDAMLLHPRLLRFSAGDTLDGGDSPAAVPAIAVPLIP